jgi:hypothetical protein
LEQRHEEEGVQGEFSQTENAKSLREQFVALEADERMFRKQAQLLSTGRRELGTSRRRAFIELFTTSKIGLGVLGTGRGRRDTSAQSQFREACIKAYNSQNPDPRRLTLWCPIIKDWVPQTHGIAAHIFAYMHGQEVMDTIFGMMEKPELFSPLNGMIVSDLVENIFDEGFMTIVPRLSDNPTLGQIALWNNSEPKEYKIRIIDPTNRNAQNFIGQLNTKWEDLDGTNVEFRSSFRPRARYLYFHYCIQVLRRAWRASDQHAAQQLQKEFGKGYWGTVGPYLPESMLRAFVEELGHEYEGLLTGAVDDRATANEEDRNLLVAVASSQVKAPRRADIEDDDEDDDEDRDKSGESDND